MKLADCYRLLTHSDRPALVSSVIGSSLAQTYGGVLREPIPRRMLELAERLERNRDFPSNPRVATRGRNLIALTSDSSQFRRNGLASPQKRPRRARGGSG